MNIPLKLWHALALWLVLAVPLAWAASRITELTEISGGLAGGDWLEMVDASDTTDNANGSSRRVKMERLGVDYALASDYTVSSTTGTEITGIGPMTVTTAGTYKLECWLMAQNATAANGADFGVNYTGTVTEMVATIRFPSTGTTASTGTADGSFNGDDAEGIVAHGSVLTESTTAPNLNVITAFAAVENAWLEIHALMTVSDTGDVELWAASEASTTLTVQSGSYCTLRRIA